MEFRKYAKRIWWILVVAWCIFIFIQSQQNAVQSGSKSALVVEIMNNIISRIIGAGKITVSEFFIRKTAHFLEYCILGFLLSGALKKEGQKTSFPLLAILLSAAYAASDEVHQYFIPGRAMRLFDVFIDTCGASAGTLIMYLCCLKKFTYSAKSKW